MTKNKVEKSFTFHYVSIKSSTGGHYHSQEQKFTFHYVSIKSWTA